MRVMRVQCKARAIVALAAAYAVVVQATLLAIGGGPMAGNAGLAALCSAVKGANPHSAPAEGGDGGHGGCPAACLACCCGAPVTPAATAVIPSQRATARWVAINLPVVPALPFSVAGAHRARAPPRG
jgi:hypothetical protein